MSRVSLGVSRGPRKPLGVLTVPFPRARSSRNSSDRLGRLSAKPWRKFSSRVVRVSFLELRNHSDPIYYNRAGRRFRPSNHCRQRGLPVRSFPCFEFPPRMIRRLGVVFLSTLGPPRPSSRCGVVANRRRLRSPSRISKMLCRRRELVRPDHRRFDPDHPRGRN